MRGTCENCACDCANYHIDDNSKKKPTKEQLAVYGLI